MEKICQFVNSHHLFYYIKEAKENISIQNEGEKKNEIFWKKKGSVMCLNGWPDWTGKTLVGPFHILRDAATIDEETK